MSIKGKLVVILSVILMLFILFAAKMFWDSREAHLQIHSAAAALDELHAVLKTRAAIVTHITRTMDYLFYQNNQKKRAIDETAALVDEAHAAWVAAIERRSELGEDEQFDIALAAEVERKYSEVKKTVDQAFNLADAGEKEAAYDILEETVERWINHVLSQEIDAAETNELNDVNTAFNNVLLKIGNAPWGSRRVIKHINVARNSIEYFLRADKVFVNICMQFRELMDYQVSGQERELGAFEEHGLDAKTNMQALTKALTNRNALGWESANGNTLQRIVDLEKHHQTFHFMAAQTITKKKNDQPQELMAFVETKLHPFVELTLLRNVRQEIEYAHQDIDQAMQRLLTMTTMAGLEGVFVSGIVLSIIGFFMFNLVRGVIMPLRQLTKGTEMVGMGQLDHRIGLQAKDELGQLARSFDKMAETLQQSQEEIISAKEYTDDILSTMCDTLFVISPSGTIRTVNDAICLLLGYEKEELIGRPVEKIIEHGLPVENGAKQCNIRSAEMTYIGKDGRRVPVSFSSSAMRNEGGKIEGIVCVAQDMTGVIAANQAKKRLERRLVVSEKLAAVSQLAAGLAHEIRNPLASIDVNLKNLEDECRIEATASNGPAQYFSIIASEIQRLNRFLEKFVRSMVPHETKLKPIPCILEDIVHGALYRVRTALEMKSGEVKIAAPPEQICIECDRERLTLALANILQNAMDAMPDSSEIMIEFQRDKEWSVIRVIDSGSGITPEEIRHAFDFHFSTKEGGMGVGLPLTQLIIEQHDGTIEIESEVGKGTCVIVKLPVKGGMCHG